MLQHLFARIIPTHPVVWVNGLGHRLPRLTVYDMRRAVAKLYGMIRGSRAPAGEPSPARVIEPKALPWHGLSAVRALNTWSLRRDIRRALDAVAPGRAPVLISGTPMAHGIVGSLGELASVYFCMDDYGELPGVSRQLIAPLEAMMLERVDAVVATAAALADLRRPRSGRTFQLPQGVNYDRFAAEQAIPADLAAIPRPRIGFAGGVGSACDFGLLEDLASALPDASIVLVGPPEPGIIIPRRPNIHALGPRPYEQLPSYVQHFDVGIIPYVRNEWTVSVDPLKLLEYLAAGIPVVATGIPEVYKYSQVVHVSESAEEFVAAVVESIRAPGAPEQRRAVARANTWDTRALRLLEIVETLAQEREACLAGASG